MTNLHESALPTRGAAHLPTGPMPGTVMHPTYASAVARLAYVWGWPLVNMHNRREVFRKVPGVSYVGGAPMAPPNHLGMYSDYVDARQRVVAHPNQDVVYGFGIASPGESPVVVQVPEFDDRFWVYALYDQRTDEVAEIGRQYGTAPGFYLIADAGWSGEIPAGIAGVFRLSTSMGVIVPRVFMDDTVQDREAVQQVISRIDLYPLAAFDGRMKVTDWKKIPSVPAPAGGRGEMRWVEPQTYFDQLGAVLDEVPPLPGEEALYAQMRALLAAAATDTAVKTAMVEAAARTEAELVDELFHFSNVGVLLPGHWTRGFNGAAFGTDYLTRLAMAKSNIFVNRTEETVYFYQYRDAAGDRLSGENRYTLTFGQGALPPVRGFWSLTLYDDQHFFNVNDLERYSFGTKNKTLRFAADGSLTIHIQKDRPADDLVSNWLPAPAGAFATTIRAYWPEQPLVEGTWLPPVIEKL